MGKSQESPDPFSLNLSPSSAVKIPENTDDPEPADE
jgi:hypothetical protein